MEFTIRRLFVLTLYAGVILGFIKWHFESLSEFVTKFGIAFAIPFRLWAWIFGTDYWVGYSPDKITDPGIGSVLGFIIGGLTSIFSIACVVVLMGLIVIELWNWSKVPKEISPEDIEVMSHEEFHDTFVK